MTTPKITKDTYWLNVEQLLLVFPDIPNRNALYKRIANGTFPVPTFKIGKRRFADRAAVQAYFRKIREQAIRDLEESS